MNMQPEIHTVKSLFRAKIMKTEGIRASNYASEGSVFIPPADDSFWIRESCGEWVCDCSAEECGRITGTITFEVYVRPDAGMRKADLLCGRIIDAFDPFAGPFGDPGVQIQVTSLRRTALFSDDSWNGSGIRIEFAAWANID